MDDTKYGWIKLEVPASASSREVMKFMVTDLTRTLGERGITVNDSQGTSRIVEEQDCETYYEKTLEATSLEFNHELLRGLQKHYNNMHRRIEEEEEREEKRAVFSPWNRGTLTLHSADFWRTPLISHVKGVALSAIYFGNIQGGTFLNHWEVSFWTDTLRRIRHQSPAEGPLNNIRAEFGFDKNDILGVHFQTNDKWDKKKKRADQPHYYLTVRRQWIRRIIVDLAVSDKYCPNRVRIHFELNCPVLIKRGVVDEQKRGDRFAEPFYHRRCRLDCEWGENGTPEAEAVSGSPYFTIEFDPTISMEEIYRYLARLRARSGVSIEFASIPFIDIPIGRRYPYARWAIVPGTGNPKPTETDSAIFNEFLSLCLPVIPINVNGKKCDANDERRFAITYLIQCLLSRGAVVKDQLLLEEIHWERFLELVIRYYQQDDKLCEAALEDLVHMVDGRKRVGSLIRCFDSICQNRQRMQLVNGLTDQEQREGFMRVRKLIFTPTRVIYVAPETIMGNRVLRKFDHDGTQVLRVTFRDDDNQKMRSTGTEDLLDMTANRYLMDGIRVANRDYGFLGCSNSQMRDNGAYFMQKYTDKAYRNFIHRNKSGDLSTFRPKIDKARKTLGRFEKVENIPKMMARLGQCFTQSRMSGVVLPRIDYIKTFDISGGRNGLGKGYEFSDGVGAMSMGFAEMISKQMGFRGVPSCFQIRFRGMKGVLAIEPLLDDFKKWKENGSIGYTYSDKIKFDLSCAFRLSQIKFPTKIFDGEQLEIVKFSSPVPVALNKPFINILDQVSEMQSIECHRRVTGRIEELLDHQMRKFGKQMNDETHCRIKLNEFPRRYHYDDMKPMYGFTLSSEPFFRSLIKASIKFSISKQLRKEQIPIPRHLGRSMLGVVDETGRLQYGQIFVQFANNHSLKLLRKEDAKTVLLGTVLITKNPCIVAGDVRIFEAVDIPELHHLYDVVVFPQSGPRPHPDEMAGSDLDGDEYSVIWDQKLLLDKNEKPFDFSVEKEVNPYDPEKIDELMKNFYVEYLKLDSVGVISNSHLHCSDQYGINAEVCMSLAKKNCQAVDFTKSGNPPEPLVREWTELKNGEFLPPEMPERIPDYHMGNDRDPMYASPRLCGKLFREYRAVDDVIKISEERDEQVEIPIDETIHVPNYKNYLETAKRDMANYNGQLRSIMENYGIKTEGEIISGCILDMRNRISDKDQDDMSFYNTNQMIETKINELIRRCRENFFVEFGGFRSSMTMRQNAYDETNVLYYVCENPSEQMTQKAVAYYRVCYEEAQDSRENRKLSFPWLVYDIIAYVKKRHTIASPVFEMGGRNPMYTMLEKHRHQYMIDNEHRFKKFKSRMGSGSDESERKAEEIVKMYMHKNPGLDVLVFILTEWAEEGSLFEGSPMRRHHFLLLIILFATKNVSNGEEIVKIFHEINMEEYKEEIANGSFRQEDPFPVDKMSDFVVKFLEMLASRKFRKLSHISFQPIGFSSIFMRGQWIGFHTAALKTYYNILFNLRFEELPISSDPTLTKRVIAREMDPFVVELPRNCNTELIREKMIEHTSTQEIAMREMKGRPCKEDDAVAILTTRYLVSARGSLESLQKLKQLVSVTIPIKSHLGGGKDVAKQMAHLCYKRIVDGLV